MRKLIFFAVVILLVPAVTRALAAAGPPAPFGGEAVVHVDGKAIVVGLDETGSGVATRVFFITTTRARRDLLDLRAPARVFQSQSYLVVFIPRDHHILEFAVEPGRGSQTLPSTEGSAVLGVEDVEALIRRGAPEDKAELVVDRIPAHKLIAYSGKMRAVVTLDEIERGGEIALKIEGPVTKLLQPDHQQLSGDNGGTCKSSCSATCKDPKSGADQGSCSATCSASECATCECGPTVCGCSPIR